MTVLEIQDFTDFWGMVHEQMMIFKVEKWTWTTERLEEEIRLYLAGESDRNSIFYTACYYELKARQHNG